MMFETTLHRPPTRRGAMLLGYWIEGLLLGILVFVPLVGMDALPKILVQTPIPPPPLASARAPQAKAALRPTPRRILDSPIIIPRARVPLLAEPAVTAQALSIGGAWPSRIPSGVPGGIGSTAAALPPAPPVSRRSSGPGRIKVGRQVEAARIVFQPKPEYPALAKMARIEGTVRLQALISVEGVVKDLRVLSGHPLLVNAALDAVARWRYQPTLLNGEPVEVVTEIDVKFSLSD